MAVTVSAPTSRVVVNGTVRFTWTSSYPQTAYEILYRVAGTTAWQTFGRVSSTAQSIDVDVSRFSNFQEYHFRIAVYHVNSTSGTSIYNGSDMSAAYSIITTPKNKIADMKVRYGNTMVEVPVYTENNTESTRVAMGNGVIGVVPLTQKDSVAASELHAEHPDGRRSFAKETPTRYTPSNTPAATYVRRDDRVTSYSYYLGYGYSSYLVSYYISSYSYKYTTKSLGYYLKSYGISYGTYYRGYYASGTYYYYSSTSGTGYYRYTTSGSYRYNAGTYGGGSGSYTYYYCTSYWVCWAGYMVGGNCVVKNADGSYSFAMVDYKYSCNSRTGYYYKAGTTYYRTGYYSYATTNSYRFTYYYRSSSTRYSVYYGYYAYYSKYYTLYYGYYRYVTPNYNPYYSYYRYSGYYKHTYYIYSPTYLYT